MHLCFHVYGCECTLCIEYAVSFLFFLFSLLQFPLFVKDLLLRCEYLRTQSSELGSEDVSLLGRCSHFRGWYVQALMELGPEDVSLLERCPHFRGWYVQASMELGPEDVSLLDRCHHFRGWYVQASMELGPEDVSLLERCPHFRGWYVQASMELGPEDVSLLERCPHFRGWYVQASMELGPEDVSLLERCHHFRGWYFTYTHYSGNQTCETEKNLQGDLTHFPHCFSTVGGIIFERENALWFYSPKRFPCF